MLAMNAEPDPEGEDRKGCSGHIGKMIYSASVEQLALCAYVPDAEFNKSAGKVDVTAWMDHVLGIIGGEVTKKATAVQSLIPNTKTGDILTGTTGKQKGKIVVAVAKAIPRRASSRSRTKTRRWRRRSPTCAPRALSPRTTMRTRTRWSLATTTTSTTTRREDVCGVRESGGNIEEGDSCVRVAQQACGLWVACACACVRKHDHRSARASNRPCRALAPVSDPDATMGRGGAGRGFLQFYNFFKHVPDDLVTSGTPGVIISIAGTIIMMTLFLFELSEYFTLKSSTTLVVDEFRDEVLRANFNVTLHAVPCEYLSVSDMTGTNKHNVSKDILKWRLSDRQEVIDAANPEVAKTAVEHKQEAEEAAKKVAAENPDHPGFDLDMEKDYEPPDTNLSQSLTAETFETFLGQHELSVVNFFAPWCVWCRRFEPTYLKTASEVPDLHFHGHARLAQVDCVANQAFCFQQNIRAYPTVRMYKDGDGKNFELFTGERTDTALLQFIREQMSVYKFSHDVARSNSKAQFDTKHGALSAGADLYSAMMFPEAAKTFCSSNPSCSGFTWRHVIEGKTEFEGVSRDDVVQQQGKPKLIYFKRVDGRADARLD